MSVSIVSLEKYRLKSGYRHEVFDFRRHNLFPYIDNNLVIAISFKL